MNLVIRGFGIGRISLMPRAAVVFSTIVICMTIVGCSDEVVMPSAGELMEFENAGPLRPTVDMNRLAKAKISGGPYKVVDGDVLELTMPGILFAVTHEQAAGADKVSPYLSRIGEGGTIHLPLAGEIKVTGKTLAQIESAVVDAYYPAYSASRPYVFVRVAEYRTAKVSITGAVTKPGIYSLRSDQMSLVALLMEAGGIADEGAAVIRIIHTDNGSVSNERAISKDIDSSLEKRIESQAVPQLKLAADESSSNGPVVRLAFEQSSASSTMGTLRVTRGQAVVLVERLDVANKEDRLLLLDKLAHTEPRVFLPDVDADLCALAQQIKQTAPVHNGQSGIPGAGAGYRPNVNNTLAERKVTPERLAARESRPSGINADQSLWPQAAPQRYSNSNLTNGGHVQSGTIHPRRGFYADVSAESFAANPRAEAGSGRITGPPTPDTPQELVLPIKGLNIPFADVVLHDGDTVIVERLAEPLFSVMGLVNRGGNFPYPPDVQYNLMQALAFAGGLDPASDPRYATIYRLQPDGTIVHAVFQVAKVDKDSRPDTAFNIRIKPGDVIVVEHTPRTESKLFLDRVFNVNFGAYVPVWR